MIPMLPANEVSMVRAFFVIRLLRLSESAVRYDIERVLADFSASFLSLRESLTSSGALSGSPS